MSRSRIGEIECMMELTLLREGRLILLMLELIKQVVKELKNHISGMCLILVFLIHSMNFIIEILILEWMSKEIIWQV